ncbi:MAG: DUF1841 family protein [Chromatiales bacterium]|nr:DUF1841 family protein [Chromatiales bacterium]
MYSQDRDQLRRVYCSVFAKMHDDAAMEPMEQAIARVIGMHPEYHRLLASPETAIGADYLPEMGESNPFLHMGLHLALHEQLATDRPAGIRTAYQTLISVRDVHDAEHAISECLATVLWEAQRDHREPDEAAYLRCIRVLAGLESDG